MVFSQKIRIGSGGRVAVLGLAAGRAPRADIRGIMYIYIFFLGFIPQYYWREEYSGNGP